MKGIIIKLKYVYFAIITLHRPKLGDVVRYKKIDCLLIQGVAAPYWDLIPVSEMEKQRRTRWNRVHESDFKIPFTWKRIKSSFMFTYNFYMGYWYRIDLNYPITKGVGLL